MTQEPPLVIDLDGTLLRSDLLFETGLAFLRDQPLRFLAPLRWLARSKAVLKRELAYATQIDVSVMPFDRSVVEFIEVERARGRRVVLATASHRSLADQVAGHLHLFDEVLATEAGHNLSAQHKRDALVSAYGERGFDYVGNSRDDLLVWQAARHAYVVNAASTTERQARRNGNVVGVLKQEGASLRDWISALRLHQWVKNLLIFVPLFAGHQYGDAQLLSDAFIAFLVFGLCASSVYILNDLADLQDDRKHPRKRLRPFAAGRLPVSAGVLVFPILLLGSFGLAAWLLPAAFVAGLAVYYLLTVAYSFTLKRYMVIDVVALAALYTIRIVVGGLAVGIPMSFWLLAFATFIFLSLALVKRYTEVAILDGKAENRILSGRGYFPDDRNMIAALGAAAGYMAVMVLALYINDSNIARFYRHPEYVWLACPIVLVWISRVWMLSHRGQMNDDPVVFAVRDGVSLALGGLLGLVYWMAT